MAIEITDREKFNSIVRDALVASRNEPRWQTAIWKAVNEIDANGAFMTFDAEENHLIIWSQMSNRIYTANGVCQCKAYNYKTPCFHRAAARLIRLYLAADEPKATPEPSMPTNDEMSSAPYMAPTSSRQVEKFGRYRI